MNFLRWIFRTETGWRAQWRFAAFLFLYIVGGKVLDPILTRIHFPDRSQPARLRHSRRPVLLFY